MNKTFLKQFWQNIQSLQGVWQKWRRVSEVFRLKGLNAKLHFSFITSLELSKVMADLGERLSEEEVNTWLAMRVSRSFFVADWGDDEMGRQGEVNILHAFHFSRKKISKVWTVAHREEPSILKGISIEPIDPPLHIDWENTGAHCSICSRSPLCPPAM